MVQVLAACGVDVDRAVPWAKPWFLRYQMADGGFNCDGDAYSHRRVSELDGRDDRAVRGDAAWCVDPGAADVSRARRGVPRRSRADARLGYRVQRQRSARQRRRGSCRAFRASYFYDVLRGLRALVRWAELSGAPVPAGALAGAITHLLDGFPDGVVRLQRRSYEKPNTLARGDDGTWHRGPASRFALLEATSIVGAPSATLTRQWEETRQAIVRLALV